MLGLLEWLAVAYGVIAAVLFLSQRLILFRPDKTRPDLARAGIAGVREITVTTDDGLDLLAWYMPPAHLDGRVVLHLHGNAGHIGHRAYRLANLKRFGWGALLLEYRGFGGNLGHPSEAGLLTDARAGLAALRAMGFPPRRILVWGESLGSGLAVRLAVEQEMEAVVLEAPYTSITDMARRRFPYVPVNFLLLDRFDSLAWVGRVRVPILMLHGARDRIIPVDMGRVMFNAAPEPKQLWIAPDAGHLDLVEAGAVDEAAEFLQRMEAARAIA